MGKKISKRTRELIKYSKRLAGRNGSHNPNIFQFLKDGILPKMEDWRGSVLHHKQSLLVSKFLYEKRFRKMSVEQPIYMENGVGFLLKPDLYARKGNIDIIVEVETGYYLEHNHKRLNHDDYTVSRFIGKMRYAELADHFYLAFPEENFNEGLYNGFRVPLVDFFSSKPEDRDDKDVQRIKRYIDQFYCNPPISANIIRNMRLSGLLLSDIDEMQVTLKRFRGPLKNNR